ncbi:hypothetical protein L3Q82_012231, partial [Scortum barcoo]
PGTQTGTSPAGCGSARDLGEISKLFPPSRSLTFPRSILCCGYYGERRSPGLRRGSPIGRWKDSPFPPSLRSSVRVFDVPASPFCVSSRLLTITQGRRSVAEYTLEFQTLAAEVDWTKDSLRRLP